MKKQNHLINPNFQGVNRLFVLSFENEDNRISHWVCYPPKVEIKDFNVMIDDKTFPINQQPFSINDQLALLEHTKSSSNLISNNLIKIFR